MNEEEILGLFDKWSNALSTQNLDDMISLYAKDSVLLPTFSFDVCPNPETKRNYFKPFLMKNYTVVLETYNIQNHGDIAINSGVYKFTNKQKIEIKARYTYVYKKIDNNWLIVQHHSSYLKGIINV
ncbi:MAG: Unknown protein [uncultured Campylobacterales bacterium]|uniref:Calcium/calmodulin-dependent protein kinase II association-domain domain-containing protein n=1 Tax=uncultured Campylobacterales bacterium TaxID=352960 RepID=A0A6S6S781_9BACT|nr:MAG: Unknown protein [uncultured Campylobacterales bacterium]